MFVVEEDEVAVASGGNYSPSESILQLHFLQLISVLPIAFDLLKVSNICGEELPSLAVTIVCSVLKLM